MPPGSEPASGSDRANAGDHSPVAQRGRNRSFCSSVPKSLMGSVPSSCTIRISAVDAHALAISSIAMLSISVPVPVPPCSTSNGSPSTSCSPSSARRSCGYSASRSISGARGAIRSPAMRRMVSRKSRYCWGIVYSSASADMRSGCYGSVGGRPAAAPCAPEPYRPMRPEPYRPMRPEPYRPRGWRAT